MWRRYNVNGKYNVNTCKSYKCNLNSIFSKERRRRGLEYIPTFPPLLLKTVTESDVFLYPTLLPRIPFIPTAVFPAKSEIVTPEQE